MLPTYPYEPGVFPNDWRNAVVGFLAGDPPDNAIGADGMYFLDLSNSTVWGPKGTPTEGAWPSPPATLGNGSNAIVGVTNGVVPSNTIGINGDYFIDIGASIAFGPKGSGVWPTPGRPIGGTENTLFGNSAGGPPNISIGIIGDYFWDVSTSRWYGPKVLLGWPTTPTPVAGGVNVIFGPSNGRPSNTIGIVGSYFFDTLRLEYYGPKPVSGWGGPRGFLSPAQIPNLANMIAGASTGAAPSNAIGADNNYFFDTDTGNVYGPKSGGAWPTTPVYSPSMSSADGNTLTGTSTGAPSDALGNDGDYFINTSDLKLYGPKAAGAWPPTGLALTSANTITGSSGGAAPSNAIGINGDYFIDTTNGYIYGPKAAGAWPATPAYKPGGVAPSGGAFRVGDIAGFVFSTPPTSGVAHPGWIYQVTGDDGLGIVTLTPIDIGYSGTDPALAPSFNAFTVLMDPAWTGIGVGAVWQVIIGTATVVSMQKVS